MGIRDPLKFLHSTNLSSSRTINHMAASDYLSKSLFHGSKHLFEKGDIVTPQNGDYAYVTSDRDYAQLHGAHTYKVEPIDHEEYQDTTSEAYRTDSLNTDSVNDYAVGVSKKGFRVKGKISSK